MKAEAVARRARERFPETLERLRGYLNGVMDPETGAHGPNESLDLGVFEKAIVTNVYLLDELSRLGRRAIASPPK